MNKRGLKISTSDFFNFIGWGLCFAPPIVYRVSGKVTFFIQYVSLFYFSLLFIQSVRKVYSPAKYTSNKTFKLFYIMFLAWSVLIIALRSPQNFRDALFEMILPWIYMMILVYRSVIKNKSDDFFKGFRPIYWLSVFYIVLNFFSIVLFKNGIFSSDVGSSVSRANWFLGSKNNQTSYLIVNSVWIMLFYNKKNRLRSTVLIGMAFFAAVFTGEQTVEFMGGSSTGILALFIILVYAIFYFYFDRFPLMNFRFRLFEMLFIAINVVLISGSAVPFIRALVENVLHKNMTFSNRTFIWQDTLLNIAQHPIVGYGEQQIWINVRLSSWINGTTYVYNLFLKYLLDFGIIGVVLFILSLYSLPQLHNKRLQPMQVGLIVLFISGLMNEVDFAYIYFFPFAINLLVSYYGTSINEGTTGDI